VGNVAAGLIIGRIMQLRHYLSAVIAGDVCASACALAWLSSQPRVMDEDARIGFHAAFIRQGDEKIETGVGNALIGAYLQRLGLSRRGDHLYRAGASRDYSGYDTLR
jgi:hypothetical protein